MKNINEFFLSKIDEYNFFINEDGSTTTTSGVDNPDAKPLSIKNVKRKKVFGYPCFEVDSDTYFQCMHGKLPFSRWSSYISDETIRNEIKSTYQTNKKVLLQDEKSGSMVYIK